MSGARGVGDGAGRFVHMEENEVARHIGVAGGVVGLGGGVIRKFLAGGAVRNPGERVPGGGNTGIFDGGGEIAGAGGEAGGVELQPAVAGVPLGVAVAPASNSAWVSSAKVEAKIFGAFNKIYIPLEPIVSVKIIQATSAMRRGLKFGCLRSVFKLSHIFGWPIRKSGTINFIAHFKKCFDL